jgi:uncharacterized membrane protein
MTALTSITAVLGLLGSALVGGIFFAFSSFVMKALARVPAHEGIAAMQSINVVVLNPSFLGTFAGTALASIIAAWVAVMTWGDPAAPWLLGGALLYLGGTFLLTGVGNVPLNDKLAAIAAADPGAVETWEHYLDRWTRLNTARTVASLSAAAMFTVGLVQSVTA